MLRPALFTEGLQRKGKRIDGQSSLGSMATSP